MRIKNYINGTYQDHASGEWLDNYDPSIGEVYGQIPNSNAQDIEEAYACAKAAFPAWSNTTLDARSRILLKIADLIEANLDRLAEADWHSITGILTV